MGGVERNGRTWFAITRLALSRTHGCRPWPIRSFSALPFVLTFWQPDVKTGAQRRLLTTTTVFFPDFAQGLRVCIWPTTGTAWLRYVSVDFKLGGVRASIMTVQRMLQT
jgi:hypothetical protein